MTKSTFYAHCLNMAKYDRKWLNRAVAAYEAGEVNYWKRSHYLIARLALKRVTDLAAR